MLIRHLVAMLQLFTSECGCADINVVLLSAVHERFSQVSKRRVIGEIAMTGLCPATNLTAG